MELKGNLAIYGAGNIGKDVLLSLQKMQKKVVCFIDQNKSGNKIDNIKIISLEEIKSYEIDIVIIGIFSSPEQCETNYIINNLVKYNLKKIITFEEFFQSFYTFFNKSNYYWLTSTEYFKKDIEKINKVKYLFIDEKSRELYDAQIRHRLGESYKILPKPEFDSIQYLSDDVPINRNNINFIDLGAYTGDTILTLLENGVTFNKILAFEPDIGNFLKLSENINKIKNEISEFFLFPTGVADINNVMFFDSAESSNSSFIENGNSSVPVISIDDCIFGFNPDYIKIDIEGFELNALKGLKNTISKFRPNIAVCLYHLPNDIYDIPIWFNENFENYSLYLRVHFSHCFETVLYAISAEQSRAEQSRAEQSRAEQSRA